MIQLYIHIFFSIFFSIMVYHRILNIWLAKKFLWVFLDRVIQKSEWTFWPTSSLCYTVGLWPPHAKSWLTGKDWCWEGLGAGGEGDDRGWDGWMASPTRWTWVWVNSGSWWGTGSPGVLQSMGSQRVGHDWATELNWTLIIFPQRPYCPEGIWIPWPRGHWCLRVCHVCDCVQ